MVNSIFKTLLQITTFIFIYVDVSSASSLKCEVAEYQGMVNPEFPDSIYRSGHISATVSSPQSFKFEGPSNVGFTISRAVAQSPGFVRLEVDAMDIASGETETCSLDKVELKSISGFYMYTEFGPPTNSIREPSTIVLVKFSSLYKTPKRWNIRLYDPSNGGTIEDGPYALQATINVNLMNNAFETTPIIFPRVDIDPKLPWRSLDPKDSGSFSLQECQSVPGPIREGVVLKLVDRIRLSDIPLDNSSLVFAVASGRRLYARLVGSDLNTRPSIRLYTGSFLNPVCSQTILSNSDYVVAQQPWENLYPTWRVELEGGSTSTGYVEFYREDAPELDQSWFAVDRLNLLDCVDRKVVDRRRFKPAPAKPNHFQKATSVSLKIHDDTNSLTNSNLQLIHQAILDAANLWRFACTSCSINQLAIISVDGDVYLLDGINLPIVNPPTNTETPQNRLFVPPPLQPFSKGFNNRINARGHIQRYNYVSSILGDKRAAICEPDENHTRHFINFSDTPVCRPTRVASENELKIDLVFIDGSTSCGDAVGCWNNNGLIQFDAKHFRYYLDHPSNTIIGRGEIPVDLMRVLTHEAGHWIGLDHVAGPTGIMSEYYEETRCIDDEAIVRLNAIVTGKQKAPLRPTGDALKYRRPEQ